MAWWLVPDVSFVEVSVHDSAARGGVTRARERQIEENLRQCELGRILGGRVRAYKVLIDGRSGFTGYRWPLPTAGAPGEWVTTTGPLELCGNGVHACTVGQLAQWIGEELWTIELGGEILEAEPALVAARGRLLGPVAAWDQAAREAFGQACARRANEAVQAAPASAPLLEAINRFAAAGRAGPAGYWAAVLAGERVAGMRSGPDYDAAFGRERAAQAAWLESELGAPG